jgi:hypothetical protein
MNRRDTAASHVSSIGSMTQAKRALGKGCQRYVVERVPHEHTCSDTASVHPVLLYFL